MIALWRGRDFGRVDNTHKTHTHSINSRSDSDAWPAAFPATPIPDPMRDVVAAPDKAMDAAVWLDELDANGLLAPHAVLSMFERGRSDALGVSERVR